jgi:hypothetical protein
MYVVRGKSGKVVGTYTTRAAAEARIAQLRAEAERLAPYKFGSGRAGSPIRGAARLSEYNKILKPYRLRISKSGPGFNGWSIWQGMRLLELGIQDIPLAGQIAKSIIDGRRTPTYGEYVPRRQ